MSNYFSISDGYDKQNIVYKNSQDLFPFRNYWRNNPLSNQSIIKPNVAGYYPYPTVWKDFTPMLKPDYEYKWQNVCSTILPTNKSYEETPEPILYR